MNKAKIILTEQLSLIHDQLVNIGQLDEFTIEALKNNALEIKAALEELNSQSPQAEAKPTTLKGLLQCCSNGELPTVRYNNTRPIFKDGAKSIIGKVVAIKPFGCAVEFEGLGYSTWFHSKWQDDKRSRYMADLSLA